MFLLARFANPIVPAVDERVVVDAFTVIVGTEVAFHNDHSITRIIGIG
jgi:hypothetical protein